MDKLLLAIILCPLFSFGQNCRYTVDETDAFTGAKKLQTESRAVYSWKNNENLYLVFRRIDEVYKLDIILSEAGVIDNGAILMLKLSDGDIIKLPADNNYFYDVEDYGSVISKNIKASYDISEGQLKKIAASGIIGYRVYFTKSYKNLNAGKKFIPRVQEAARCIIH